jgi:hypothetical protein
MIKVGLFGRMMTSAKQIKSSIAERRPVSGNIAFTSQAAEQVGKRLSDPPYMAQVSF